jgi:uncharacterized LabA/DUF88 family protein
MDVLHAGGVDGFCLVSSDSDFTRLATRIREAGLVVYGFGERKQTYLEVKEVPMGDASTHVHLHVRRKTATGSKAIQSASPMSTGALVVMENGKT